MCTRICKICAFVFVATAPPPQLARASSFTTFLGHTQRRTTVGMTPLEEWSARRRDLYLKTHNQNSETLAFIKTQVGWLMVERYSKRHLAAQVRSANSLRSIFKFSEILVSTSYNTHNRHPCPRWGFEPTISASERPQTYALDRAPTGTGDL